MFSTEYIILLGLLGIYFIDQKSKNLLYIILGYMILLGMMRGLNVGTDHFGYQEDFKLITSFSSADKFMSHRFETGFIGLIILFKQFSNDYLLFTAFLVPPTIIGVYIFIKQHEINIPIAISLFVITGLYFKSFNIMRQMLCISLIIPFVSFIYDKKYLSFALVTISVSLLIHKSSLIMLILIPLYECSIKYEINKKWLYVVVVLSFVLFYGGKTVLQDSLITINSTLGLNEFDSYIKPKNVEDEIVIGNTISLFYTLYTIILIYIYNKKNIFILLAVVTYTTFYNIFQMMGAASGRVAQPFAFFFLIIIPQILETDFPYKKQFIFFTIAFFSLQFFNSFYLHNLGEVNPYVWRDF